ncbi:protein kinase [Streptomyces sp. NPDC006879]|uniref:serine/threonine-protein kinase n=1 Tax=Streptomyces sp. NPDC006879 TaxID=3364767 RepID=UPI003698A97F
MNTSEAGRRLIDGRFELISPLGSGGMGTVWRARDIALHREVALKEVRPPDPAVAAANPQLAAQLRGRAIREARALARLAHPHVVTIHHIVEPADGSHPWIVMELVQGGSLHDRLADGPMPVADVAALGLDVLSALRAAHSAGVQHRDVKPANVLLRADGSAVLTDFGIAALRESTSLTATGDLIGSPEYIAPERVRGEEGNPASDLWSLGMLMYVAAEGRHPFRRATTLATVVAVLDDPLPAPTRSGPLTPVLAQLLVRDPQARPDAARLEQLLRAVATEAGPPTARTPGNPDTSAPSYPPPTGYAPTPAAARPSPGAEDSTAGAGFGPPVSVFDPPATNPAGPTRPTTTSSGAPKRRRVIAGAIVVTVLGLGAVSALNWLPGDSEDPRGKGATPSSAAATPGKDAKGSSNGPSPQANSAAHKTEQPQEASPATEGTLLTTANAKAVMEAFRKASGGSTDFVELDIYEQYAFADIPVKPGAKAYDRFEYRGGVVRNLGPGGTLDSTDGAPFDVTRMDWAGLPTLVRRAERELNVPNPNMRYVLVDRWTFNEDKPTLRVYVTNEYHAAGYLAADSSGKVVAQYAQD